MMIVSFKLPDLSAANTGLISSSALLKYDAIFCANVYKSWANIGKSNGKENVKNIGKIDRNSTYERHTMCTFWLLTIHLKPY